MKVIENLNIVDLEVNFPSQYNSITAENVVVRENITVRFFGTINKSLTLRKGSEVYLHGALNGKLINEGGKLHHYSIRGNLSQHTDNSCSW